MWGKRSTSIIIITLAIFLTLGVVSPISYSSNEWEEISGAPPIINNFTEVGPLLVGDHNNQWINITCDVDDTAQEGSNILSADISIDGGPWLPMSAVVPPFDNPFEKVNITWSPGAGYYATGVHNYVVRATDADGGTNPGVADSFTIVDTTTPSGSWLTIPGATWDIGTLCLFSASYEDFTAFDPNVANSYFEYRINLGPFLPAIAWNNASFAWGTYTNILDYTMATGGFIDGDVVDYRGFIDDTGGGASVLLFQRRVTFVDPGPPVQGPYPIWGNTYQYNGSPTHEYQPEIAPGCTVNVTYWNNSANAWTTLTTISNPAGQYSVDLLNYTNSTYVFVNVTNNPVWGNLGYNWTMVNWFDFPSGRRQNVSCGVPYDIVINQPIPGANKPTGSSFDLEYTIVDRDGVLCPGYFTCNSTTFSPQSWNKLGIVIGTDTPFDITYARAPSVIKDGQTYKMWYAGFDGTNYRILYANSTNGVNWNKQGLALDIGGTYESLHVVSPYVFKDAGLYKMWYAGHDGSNYRILYANSTDGVNWIKQGLALDIGGTNEDLHLRWPWVLKENGEYKMWYSGRGSNWRIFYASSNDGLSWSKQGLVMDYGASTLEETGVLQPCVLKTSDDFQMWYGGRTGITSNYQLRTLYATSADGYNWDKKGRAIPHMEVPGETDGVSRPCVIKDDEDGFLKMWYEGTVLGPTKIRILFAKSQFSFPGGPITIDAGPIIPDSPLYIKPPDQIFNGTASSDPGHLLGSMMITYPEGQWYINVTEKGPYVNDRYLTPWGNFTIDPYSLIPGYLKDYDNISINVTPGKYVDLLVPDGGEWWWGGTNESIFWNMSDDVDLISDLTVDIYYSTDSGATYPNIIVTGLTGFMSNPCSYNWDPLPFMNSTTVRVKVVITDTGMTSIENESLSDFKIDSSPPGPTTNVRAELTGVNDVTIYWDASPPSCPYIDHYEIWYITSGWDPSGNTYIFLDSIPWNTNNYVHADRGKNNGGSYAYQVRTFDIWGNETRTLIQAAKYGYTLPCVSDWYLVGSALVQSSTSIDHVIQGLGAIGIHVLAWDAANQRWISDMPARPDSLNDLTDITNEMGFWLGKQGDARFCTAGYITNMSIDCYSGWNLVPYPYAERNKNTDDIEFDLIANCPNYVPGSLTIFDLNQPYRIRLAASDTISNNEAGFWIQVTADTVWTVVNY